MKTLIFFKKCFKDVSFLFFLFTVFLDVTFTLKFIGKLGHEGNPMVYHFLTYLGTPFGILLFSVLEVLFFASIVFFLKILKMKSATSLILLGASICHVQGSLTWLYKLGIIGFSELISAPFYASLIFASLNELKNL
jgi:hypothetical protein